MKEKSETVSLKLNPIKEDLSKNRQYQKKKLDQKFFKDSIGIYPMRAFNFIRSEIRNTTAPNKNRPIKKNFQHLKITAKNKDIINHKIFNYNDILLSKKILGKSLPKNSFKNNKIYNQEIDNQNLSSNDTKKILLNNNNTNIIVIKKEAENLINKNKNNGFTKNINGTNIFNPIIENAKVTEEFKMIQKNGKKIKKAIEFDYIYLNKINRNNNIAVNIINNKVDKIHNKINKKLISNNSFNDYSNKGFNNFPNSLNTYLFNIDEKGINSKNIKYFNNYQNMKVNNSNLFHKDKRSVSSSITIPRNQLRQINSQIIMNGFGMYIENDLIHSMNNTMTRKNKKQKQKSKPEPVKKIIYTNI